MNNSELINKTIAFVKEKLNDAEGGHGFKQINTNSLFILFK